MGVSETTVKVDCEKTIIGFKSECNVTRLCKLKFDSRYYADQRGQPLLRDMVIPASSHSGEGKVKGCTGVGEVAIPN